MSPDAASVRRSALQRLGQRIEQTTEQLSVPAAFAQGKLVQLSGMRLEATGLNVGSGSRCLVHTHPGDGVEAEVVGFANDRVILMCEGSADGLRPGAKVTPLLNSGSLQVGEDLLGRVIDGAGQPLDGLPEPRTSVSVPIRGAPLNPMHRPGIEVPLDVGVRAFNSLVTIGRGQRMGLFAGSGVGKSTLLGMMTRFTEADVIVVGLVGERGREVREFIEHSLGVRGLSRSIVVATPADTSPLMRVAGCWRATAIAEYYRAQGKNVLLLIDSLTRFAQAQREIGLAAGEPPVNRGYTPSVFSSLPNLIERAGNLGSGSITAIYTILTEGDDLQDPIADAARAILDGHIVLSRSMAERGQFPAVDLEASISRSMLQIVDAGQLQQARWVRQAVATYQANRDLIAVGAYRSGSDPAIDLAIRCQEDIKALLEQPLDQAADWNSSLAALARTAAKMKFLQDQTADNAATSSCASTGQVPAAPTMN